LRQRQQTSRSFREKLRPAAPLCRLSAKWQQQSQLKSPVDDPAVKPGIEQETDMSLILTAIAAAAAAPHATHVVQVEHGGQSMQATYSARAEFRHKTVGAKTPNRIDMQRCQWTATIVVDRALNHGPALARTISSDKQISGSEAGACTPGRRSGERNLAQHDAAIRSHLVAIAQQDRAPLLAELDAVRNLASN
jgi:hypothetical protein